VWHTYRRENSPPNPLLFVNQESRYEVQRIGTLTHETTGSDGEVMAGYEIQYPIYINFEIDTFVADYDEVMFYLGDDRCNGIRNTIVGAKRVKRLITVNPASGDACTQPPEMVNNLEQFSRLQELHISLTESGIWRKDGEVRIRPLTEALGYVEDWEGWRKNFRIICEQIDWMRKKSGQNPVPKIEVVALQRRTEAHQKWSDDDEEEVEHDDDDYAYIDWNCDDWLYRSRAEDVRCRIGGRPDFDQLVEEFNTLWPRERE
jgi:hypothetical protein